MKLDYKTIPFDRINTFRTSNDNLINAIQKRGGKELGYDYETNEYQFLWNEAVEDAIIEVCIARTIDKKPHTPI